MKYTQGSSRYSQSYTQHGDKNLALGSLAVMVGKSSAKNASQTGDNAQLLSQPAHCIAAGEVLTQLQSDAQSGLTDAEVSKRQGIHGANALEGSGGAGPIHILMNQVLNALTMVSRHLLSQPFDTFWADWLTSLFRS